MKENKISKPTQPIRPPNWVLNPATPESAVDRWWQNNEPRLLVPQEKFSGNPESTWYPGVPGK